MYIYCQIFLSEDYLTRCWNPFLFSFPFPLYALEMSLNALKSMCESPLMFLFKICRNRKKIKFRIRRTPHRIRRMIRRTPPPRAARRGKVNPQMFMITSADVFLYQKADTLFSYSLRSLIFNNSWLHLLSTHVGLSQWRKKHLHWSWVEDTIFSSSTNTLKKAVCRRWHTHDLRIHTISGPGPRPRPLKTRFLT